MDRHCPECQKQIPVCSCGEWDCAFYKHLKDECPSERGAAYRKQVEESIARRKENIDKK